MVDDLSLFSFYLSLFLCGDEMNLPELNFLDATQSEMMAAAKRIVESSLGRTLERADPILLLLKSFIAIILQQRVLIDEVAKQNLLYYATGANLEHLGVLVGVERLPASSAKTTVEVKLSAPRSSVVTVLQGTRIHAGDNVYFALNSDVIFLAGETVHTVGATCQQAGEIGNGYEVGELNKIVDPQPFLSTITNLTKSEGGADVESDEFYRDRIRQAPESFSNAGSEGAYIFHTKSVSSLITDVLVTSENPGEVDIYALLEGGELPETEMLNAIEKHLREDNVRPLTDFVQVKQPFTVDYSINLRYLIARSDAGDAAKIIAKVNAAVDDFAIWQRSKIGRDINDTELYWRIRSAGAKRAEILSPTFEVVPENSIAVADSIAVEYAGIEED